MGLMAGAQAQADTRIGVTVLRRQLRMAVVRKGHREGGGGHPGCGTADERLPERQSKQNSQIDVLLAKGVGWPSTWLTRRRPVVIEARAEGSPWSSTTRNRARPTWPAMTRPTTWAPTPRVRHHQGQLIAKHWKAHPEWDLNKDGVIQFVLLRVSLATRMRKPAPPTSSRP